MTNYWKISPGDEAKFWGECVENNIIAIGWGSFLFELDEKEREKILSIAKKEEFKQKIMELTEISSIGAEQLWTFLREIDVGDVVLANEGKKKIIGVGIIESNYRLDDTLIEDYPLIREVYWVLKDTKISVPEDLQNRFNVTIVKLSKEDIDRLGIKNILLKHIEKANVLLLKL